MKNFADRLIARVQETCPVCVGLDPHFSHLPDFLVTESSSKGEAVLKFNKGIIDAVAGIAPVVKLQIAFYEALGLSGMQAYSESVHYAKSKGLIVIGDIKRNDIGSTAKAYAEAHFEHEDFQVDAVTLNPYLGTDSIQPFLEYCGEKGKGLFILVKTSNPSSREIQDLTVGLQPVYQSVAKKVAEWGSSCKGESGYSSVGAVVGATYPQEAELLRELMPHSPFLVPGYGAQGAGAKEVRPCFDSKGFGAIVNSSRGIIFAYEQDSKYLPQDFAQAAKDALLLMKEELSKVLPKKA
jgi:orotidine-5'-phosphate decarboxylase